MATAAHNDTPGAPPTSASAHPAPPTVPASLSVPAAQQWVVDLARRGPAHGPNPRVGCIILAPATPPDTAGNSSVDPTSEGVVSEISESVNATAAEREVLGYGWHRGAGTPHAEAAAIADGLRRAASAASEGGTTRGELPLAGATAVVSLEPCNHTGRTPPCSQALLDAGIAEVFYAVADPNPEATGGGAWLQQAGVKVTGPTEASADPELGGSEHCIPEHGVDAAAAPAHELLRPWLTVLRHRRPFVTLKLAMTLDGRIAAADGSSRWITSAQSREHAHAVRSEIDAIAVGTGTALTDNPSLTSRPSDELATEAVTQPMRVVVGYRDLPADARLRGQGGPLLQIATHDPAEVLRQLQAHGVRHVLVEGGPTLASAFLRAGLVDEIHAYLAPVFLGAGKTAIAELGIDTIQDALRLHTREVRRLGPDTLIIATPKIRPTPPHPGTAQES